jgi:hypothetical protein
MRSNDYQPDPDEVKQSVDQAGGPEVAVEEALHQGELDIEVAELRVGEAADTAPMVEGRVGSEKDREWAIGLARNALGQEVHDALEVDETLPTTAPEQVTSGFEQDDQPDITQGATDQANPPAERGQAYVLDKDADRRVTGADPLTEAGTAKEYEEPGVEHRRSRGPDEVSGPA